uniref:Capsid protein n=1 Tax=Dragonfly associated cyclovirus 1 TaxID=1234879 RepID=F1CZS2_9CIRC|nr:capsid protein [Dragonfly associated cyclovirus 1]
MVRYRRAVRRPVRRARRSRVRKLRFRRRRRYHRRITGNFSMKITKMESYSPDISKVVELPVTFTGKDFPEFQTIAPCFEAYRVHKITCTVYPQQNVATRDQTTIMPAYCMFPWPGPVPAAQGKFNNFLSVDKCKVFRGTQVGYQTYVPNTLSTVYDIDGASSTTRTSWRPRIEVTSDDAYKVVHYGGCVGMQGIGDGLPKGATAHYNLKYDIYLTFYNQKIFLK